MAQISLAYCPNASAWMLNYSAKNVFLLLLNVWNLPNFAIIQLSFIHYKVELTNVSLWNAFPSSH